MWEGGGGPKEEDRQHVRPIRANANELIEMRVRLSGLLFLGFCLPPDAQTQFAQSSVVAAPCHERKD